MTGLLLRWRAPNKSGGVSDDVGKVSGFKFLDGDLLVRFLDFDQGSPQAQKSMKGSTEAEKLAISYQEVVSVLEQLQTVH